MWELKFSEGNEVRTLTFKLHQTVDISELSDYANSEANNEKVRLDEVSRCMNIIISKSFDKTRVHQQCRLRQLGSRAEQDHDAMR